MSEAFTCKNFPISKAPKRIELLGDEHEQSSGAVSTKVLEPAFNTLQSRASEQVPAIVLLDEPELGLSEDYAGAMGAYLASKIAGMPDLAVGDSRS